MKVSEIISNLESAIENKQARGSAEVLQWLKDCSPERTLITVDKVVFGDTFWHTLVGGKSRPWVTLWNRKGVVGAASITHSNLAGGHPCKDRYWRDGYIGPTLIMVEEGRIKDSVYFPYTNKKHLKEVKDIFSSVWS